MLSDFVKEFGILTVIIIISLWLGALSGYILGAYKLASCDFEPPYKAEILYGVGAISGLNAIFGWFNLGK